MRNFNIVLIIFLLSVLQIGGNEAFSQHEHKEGKEAHEEHEHSEDKGHNHNDEHDEHTHEDGPLELSAESLELGGIETSKVSQSSFASKISVSGRIAQDVEDVKYVFSPESARIEKCHAALGSIVQKDEVVCVAKLNSNSQSMDIKAPISGTVISEFIKNGEHVDETTALYALADLSKLWANFAVYEKDIALVKLGQKILVYPLSYPDQSFEGSIVFISPRVDESTYTVKIRAEVENTNYLIKLGMSVRGEILVSDGGALITIPAEAIQTVENKTVVFKKTEEGKFISQEVEIKSRTKESVSLQHGLKEGDEIVVKGSFILKSKMMEREMGHEH